MRKTRGQRVAEKLRARFAEPTTSVRSEDALWAHVAKAVDAAIKRAVAEERKRGRRMLLDVLSDWGPLQ